MALNPLIGPRTRIVAAFISCVLGPVGFATPVVVFHGWNEGKAFLVGALIVGVIAFIASVIYILVTEG